MRRWHEDAASGNSSAKACLMLSFMASQPTTPNVPPPRNKGLIKGLLTIAFSLNKALLNTYFLGAVP